MKSYRPRRTEGCVRPGALLVLAVVATLAAAPPLLSGAEPPTGAPPKAEGAGGPGRTITIDVGEMVRDFDRAMAAYRNRDYADAAKTFPRLAGMGHLESRYMLGEMYQNGRGVEKDPARAIEWYQKAAKAGHPAALCNLGIMYRDGEGVAADPGTAAGYLRRAAMLGEPNAQLALGALLVNGGAGVERNRVDAYAWYILSDEQGNELAAKNMKVLDGALPAEQITAGKARAGELRTAVEKAKKDRAGGGGDAGGPKPAPPPPANGGGGEPAGNNPPPRAAAPAAGRLPAFLKPGARITFHDGSAVLAGVRQKATFTANGQWQIAGTNQRFNYDDARGSGGVGYLQFSIVHATPAFVAADVRSHLIVDQQNDIATATSSGGVTGNGSNLDKYWVHPARLAELQPGRDATGQTIARVRYNLRGRDYNAVRVVTETDTSYASHTYDADTGLLLFAAASTVGPPNQVLGPGNVLQPGPGDTVISHTTFVGVRDTNVPWAGGPAPRWAVKGGRLDYQGGRSVNTGVGGLPPLPPQPLALSVVFEQAVEGCVVAKATIRQDVGPGIPPVDATFPRCYGSAMFGGLWISPQTLGDLRPNQVLDEDPVTKFRTSFVGVQNNVAAIVEQGPQDVIEYFYDAQNGTLVGSRATQQSAGVPARRTEFKLAAQP